MSKFTGMKSKFDEAAKNAQNKTVSAQVGGGMVTATVNGKQEVVRITIDPQAMGDKTMLEDLVAAAINQAINLSRGLVQEEMQKVIATLGIPLPPGLDITKFF